MFVFLGAVTGVLGFIPLILSLKASKNVSAKSNLGYGALLLLGVGASFIILFAAVLLCYFLTREGVLAFVFAAAITLVLFAIVYGSYSVISRNKAAKERKTKKNMAKGK